MQSNTFTSAESFPSSCAPCATGINTNTMHTDPSLSRPPLSMLNSNIPVGHLQDTSPWFGDVPNSGSSLCFSTGSRTDSMSYQEQQLQTEEYPNFNTRYLVKGSPPVWNQMMNPVTDMESTSVSPTSHTVMGVFQTPVIDPIQRHPNLRIPSFSMVSGGEGLAHSNSNKDHFSNHPQMPLSASIQSQEWSLGRSPSALSDNAPHIPADKYLVQDISFTTGVSQAMSTHFSAVRDSHQGIAERKSSQGSLRLNTQAIPTPGYGQSKRIPHSLIERRYRHGLQVGMERLRDAIPTFRTDPNQQNNTDSSQRQRRPSSSKGASGGEWSTGKTSKLSILANAVTYLHDLESQVQTLQHQNLRIRQIAEEQGVNLAEALFDPEEAKLKGDPIDGVGMDNLRVTTSERSLYQFGTSLGYQDPSTSTTTTGSFSGERSLLKRNDNSWSGSMEFDTSEPQPLLSVDSTGVDPQSFNIGTRQMDERISQGYLSQSVADLVMTTHDPLTSSPPAPSQFVETTYPVPTMMPTNYQHYRNIN